MSPCFFFFLSLLPNTQTRLTVTTVFNWRMLSRPQQSALDCCGFTHRRFLRYSFDPLFIYLHPLAFSLTQLSLSLVRHHSRSCMPLSGKTSAAAITTTTAATATQQKASLRSTVHMTESFSPTCYLSQSYSIIYKFLQIIFLGLTIIC